VLPLREIFAEVIDHDGTTAPRPSVRRRQLLSWYYLWYVLRQEGWTIEKTGGPFWHQRMFGSDSPFRCPFSCLQEDKS
jgi:hypothetical protein